MLMRCPTCKKCGEFKQKKVNIEMTHGNFTGWIMGLFCNTCEKDEITTKEKRWADYIDNENK